MKKRIFITAVLVCSCFMICLAVIADLNGTWGGILKLPNGDLPVSYTFKIDGAKLSGTVNSDQGSLPLDSGKVNGSDFSFSLDYNGMAVKHTGKYYGDSIGIDVEFGGNKIHSTLKKVN